MKKNIVKTMLKAAATTAMVAAMFVGGNTLEAKAYNMNGDVANMTMVEYVNLYTTGQLPKATKYLCSMATQEDVNAFAKAMELRIVSDKMDIASDNFGLTSTSAEAEAQVNAELTPIATQAGVAVLRTEMLDLVNADRLASNPEAAPLAWSEELANYGLTRVVEVSNNFQSPEYLDAYNNGAHADEARIVHSGSVYKENALLNWSANTAEDANSRWIESEGHHRVRVRETYTQYAAVSYIDPVTGEEAWIELFQ